MFLVYCPYCEEHREEEEFSASGQAHMPRPVDPDSMNDEEWAAYLYFRKNARGEHRELWVHAAGCGKYFNVARNTQTYEIYATYKAGTFLESDKPLEVGASGSVLNYRQIDAGSEQ